MQIVRTIDEWKSIRKGISDLALIPTMGYLHEGHLSLAKEGKSKAKTSVVSIFVNPLQFNDPKDFEKYPVNEERDLELLKSIGTDFVFIPTKEEFLGKDKPQLKLQMPGLTGELEGKFRPGHFEGVLFIVAKLFSVIQPTIALFGKKDYQQFRVVRQMCTDLAWSIDVIGSPTVRETDGLAMSSRNARLGEKAREQATLGFRGMKIAEKALHDGNTDVEDLKEIVKDVIESGTLNRCEYVEFAHHESLSLLTNLKDLANTEEVLLLISFYCDEVRLIDNIQIQL